ncbi:Protein CBG08634 [Caenorhabditis briggsae]|uniref:Protein CBG08634 n=1 Tax=Caenorhabditis briggsae TaxID=6238 RepID=A8X6X9_CAEBR|nr:Protein CBG08634 [Caenorhabditis briggsae]CAP28390.1 Protein CBG08634 [Caenorhabditis briggsae]
MDGRLLNLYVIAFYKVVFLVLGFIGNSLFIHLIYRRKQLQSRTSILQCVQCIFHLLCQIGTVVSGVLDVGTLYRRNECLKRIAFYIFFQTAQGIIMMVIVLDILAFVKFPVFYRRLSSSAYIAFVTVPVLAFSVFTTSLAIFTTNDEFVYSCGPPFAFDAQTGVYYNMLFILLGIIVMILYLILIWIFQTSNQNRTNFLRTIKRLQLSVLIFIFTWFFGQILGFVVLRAPEFSEWSGMMFAHTVFFVCLCYSNTFYVTMMRSKEYRQEFYSVWLQKSRSSASVATFSTNSLF